MKISIKFLSLFLIFTSLCFANNLAEKRININSRALSKESERTFLLKQKELIENLLMSDQQNKPFNTYSYPPIIHSNSIHQILAIDSIRKSIMIEDESTWKIKKGDFQKILTWKTEDPILLIENDSWISSWLYGYKYKLVNFNKDTQVEVMIDLGPKYENPNTLQITSLDPYLHEIRLTDGSCWQYDPQDYYIIKQWLINDVIILGTNAYKSWFSPNYDNIMININMMHQTKVNRVE